MSDFDLAIVGAGIVGVSAALWAAKRGQKVVLIDPMPPGSGTSSGNACTVATYGCLPVNDPSVLVGLPRLVLGGDSPLSMRWSYALRNPGWMLRFLANCRSGPSQRIATQLAELLANADAGLNPLIEEAGAEDLIVARGQITIWSTEKAAEGAEAGLQRRRDLGVEWAELTPEEARKSEPGLTLSIARAVHFPLARHIRDPEILVQRFHRRFEALGGETLTQKAHSVEQIGSDMVINSGVGAVSARRVVIAAGAFSRGIKGAGICKLPLGTERGYHVVYESEADRVTRPVGWAEGGFYAVPMAKGLRLAGTVEIAGLDASSNPERLAYLQRRGAEMLGDLPLPTGTWLGYRPTMPDSLPVIGYAPGTDRIIHAFGHQHLGLTLGGITGRLVADLAEGRQPNMDISGLSAGRRFS